MVEVSQNVDNNDFCHFIYIYKDLIYNILTSLFYILQRELGPNLFILSDPISCISMELKLCFTSFKICSIEMMKLVK